MPRSPLTDTITRVQGMVSYVRQNLSDEEWNLFLDLVAPETVSPPKPTRRRKAGKKAGTTSGNSRRGLPQVRPSCVGFVLADGHQVPCNAPPSDPIHDEARGYAGYHEFVSAGEKEKGATA
jgi:hypothetical protein